MPEEDGPDAKRIRLESDAKNSASNKEINLDTIFTRKRFLTTHEEKELRKERGDLLLTLFKQHPSLVNTASARKTENNLERAAMWEDIAKKINEKFGESLEVLSVEKMKKLVTYYKKKEDGSYDNIKNSLSKPETQEDEDVEDSESTSSSSPTTSSPDQLVQLLAMITSTPGWKPDANSGQHADRFYDTKKERHDFVVNLAESYMNKMSFDSSSRSAFVNAERHTMWTNVTMKANEKFAAVLGPLGVEQAKKLYSNCKRRRKAKETFPVVPNSEELEDASQRDDSIKSGTSGDSVLSSVEEVLRGLQQSDQVVALQKKCVEQEALIQSLRKSLIEQAEETRQRMNKMLDVMKTAVEQNYLQDVEAIFRIARSE